MSRFELQLDIEAAPEAVFAVMTDPDRFARWLPHTEAIEELSGPLDRAGSRFIQRGAPGIRRPGAIIASDPSGRWHLRLAGFGERVDLVFVLESVAEATRLRVQADVRNGPAFLAPLLDRAVSRLDRRVWLGAMGHLKAEVERPRAEGRVGAVYSLDSGAGVIRIGQLLAADDRHAHLRLSAQRFKRRPRLEDVGDLRLDRPRNVIDLRPLHPTLGSVVRGVPVAGWLLLDGGFGAPHLPVTRTAFDESEPVPIRDASLTEALVAPVAAWTARRGAAFGEAKPPRIGGFYSVVTDDGFGIVKVLHVELRGVHVRTYGSRFAERPHGVDERALESRPLALEARVAEGPSGSFGIGHLPLSHASFARWQPEFVSMVLVDPDEMLGYEEWRLAKGGFF